MLATGSTRCRSRGTRLTVFCSRGGAYQESLPRCLLLQCRSHLSRDIRLRRILQKGRTHSVGAYRWVPLASRLGRHARRALSLARMVRTVLPTPPSWWMVRTSAVAVVVTFFMVSVVKFRVKFFSSPPCLENLPILMDRSKANRTQESFERLPEERSMGRQRHQGF